MTKLITNTINKHRKKPSIKVISELRKKASYNNRIHIISWGDKWIIKKEGALRATKILDTKDEAVKLAKYLVKNGNASSVISHRKDGTFVKVK